ncbi:MAG: glycosyltransferase [Candidatus Peribacteraceae bacterium]
MPSAPLISIVVPVYNEAENIGPLLGDIETHVREPHETLIVYDFPEDNTLPAIAAMQPAPANVRLIHNTLGRGVLNAYKAGFAACKGDVIVPVAGDRADEPKDIPALVNLVRGGADIAAGSRYMRGGRQVGGPFFKQMLSRFAGLSLHYLAGLPTHDATNNFRAYSRRVMNLPIESKASFALGIELAVKTHWNGWTIREVPTTWHDRRVGISRFHLWAWLPEYLRWYLLALWRAWLPGRKRQ